MKMKLVIVTSFVIGVCSFSAHATEAGKSYIDGSKSFLEIKDINRQAEAWAMCSAAYDVMAELLSEAQPAQSKQLSEFANGAQLAVTMSMFAEGLDPEITPERFNALWKVAQLAGTEIPKTRRTMLEAEAEATPKEDISKFISNLAATVEVCVENLSGQQAYIDTWRELAKSGLLAFPDE